MGALLEALQQQLAEAERFLVSADTVSENDIATAVRALNAEVFQAVKQMAEGCRMMGGAVDQSALKLMHEASGDAWTNLLFSLPPQPDDRIVLEMALQGTITAYLARFVSSWIPELEESTRGFDTIHQRMLQSGIYQMFPA